MAVATPPGETRIVELEPRRAAGPSALWHKVVGTFTPDRGISMPDPAPRPVFSDEQVQTCFTVSFVRDAKRECSHALVTPTPVQLEVPLATQRDYVERFAQAVLISAPGDVVQMTTAVIDDGNTVIHEYSDEVLRQLGINPQLHTHCTTSDERRGNIRSGVTALGGKAR